MFDWLENDLLFTIIHYESASSDASFRRYYRVRVSDGFIDVVNTTPRMGKIAQHKEEPLPGAIQGAFADDSRNAEGTAIAEQQFIIMDAPPTKENIEPFIRIAKLLAQADINVPTIFQQNLTDGFLLLEDFGSQCFLDQLNASTANDLYQTAFDSLFKLQTQTLVQNSGLPNYDELLLRRELAIFDEWFLNQLMDIQIPVSMWETVCNILTTSALEQPSTFVHRDYHSRNLMVLDSDSPGIIDFQDAVIGPITYDLVSLLRDCYIAWPEQQIEQWRLNYFERLQQAGLINCSSAQFKRWFDLMGLQRHLKAIGIFSRLHLRDGKSNYLNDIPRTLNYVTTVCATYPELAEFNNFLHQQVLPVLIAVELPVLSKAEI